MYFFYNLILVIISPIFYLLCILHPKLKQLRLKRKQSLSNLLNLNFIKSNQFVIWFHSASVGELDQSRAVARTIKNYSKRAYIIQSVYSNSVTEKQMNDPCFDATFILPFDFAFAYEPIFKKFKPDCLMIFAWDTWPNLIRSAKNSGAKTYLACASLSKTSGRTKGIAKLLTKKVFSYLDGIFLSHTIFESVIRPLVSKSTVMEVLGDTRYDAVLQRIETGLPGSRFQTFIAKYEDQISNHKPVLLGSTYPICETYLLHFLEKYNSDPLYRKEPIWIFPHKWEVDRMLVFRNQLQSFGSTALFSELVDSEKKEKTSLPKFILFDELGILAFAYKYAQFAYIGGALHHRIHNTIEPAAFGLALITGPKITSAPEAIVMRSMGSLQVCETPDEFSEVFSFMLKDKDNTRSLGEKNRNFVLENRGASERIYHRVFSRDLS
ncbi:MAG: 3-deoxy-D-manno-octulosonic acid transferase [Leptospira sp.]|nr:3-deoxy-D-manno-octulosonic acid transferase [Leptospira sp.]